MSRKLSKSQVVRWVFSDATQGPMAIKGSWDNRLRYLQQQGLNPNQVVHAGLCHGSHTEIVTKNNAGTICKDTDGLITAETNLGLVMTAADCLLIAVYDPISQIIGLVHAGRKGLARQVVTKFLTVWLREFSSQPNDILIDISPSICLEHYPVSMVDAKDFMPWPKHIHQRGEQVHLDLRNIAGQQLTDQGIRSENITVSPVCTYEDPRYFSYRRDHPQTPNLQVGYLLRRSP